MAAKTSGDKTALRAASASTPLWRRKSSNTATNPFVRGEVAGSSTETPSPSLAPWASNSFRTAAASPTRMTSARPCLCAASAPATMRGSLPSLKAILQRVASACDSNNSEGVRVMRLPLSFALRDLLGTHIVRADTCDGDGFFHGVAAEGFAEFLVDHGLDEGCGAVLHLVLDRLVQRVGELVHGARDDALEATGLGDAGVAHVVVKLGAHEIVVEPQGRVALFRAPLVVAEHDLGDAGPFAAPDRRQFVDRDAEGAVAGKAHHRHVGAADLGADDRRKAIAAGAKEARSEVFAALLEGRISVADGAVVADIRADDRLARQRGLDRAPGHARAHPVGLGLTGALVPAGAGIVVLVVHAAELLRPFALGFGDPGAAGVAALVPGAFRQLAQNAAGHLGGVADDADADLLGQADPVGVDVDLDDLGILGPVIHAIARQGRERVEARAEAEHHIGVLDQLHRRF